ncbi:MAG: phosphonoacetaldehyde hydrolase [Planctomycetota bacterium]|jgi:phosphonoacetaldehyde hydrolase|nr:phosphonoacetaldehyde hydrolase [Planctomycetota bacterium]MDR1520130.1 phosphonoacetaldehyde hydrolase [Planctomycetota bacterium]
MKTNPVSLVVCDLAGTTVDYGSRAPLAAFIEVFGRHGVIASEAETRGPMGMDKRDHLERMLSLPPIAAQWRKQHGRDSTAADLDMLFKEFMPIQTELLEAHSEVVPGAAEAVELCRSLKIKVAATTGYNRPMTDIVLAAAKRRGLTFDFSRCAAEVPAGRPAPWMIFRCMEAANAYPPSAVIKIGDTIADIEAGLNAGVWTVGVAMTGNLLGLSRRAVEKMTKAELEASLIPVRGKMAEAGAHMVIDSLADMPLVLSAARLAIEKGRHPEKPGLSPGPSPKSRRTRNNRQSIAPLERPTASAVAARE